MRLFLDDEREPYMAYDFDLYPDMKGNWVIVRNIEVAKEVLLTGQVECISLDHDLGAGLQTGYDLCKWMTENKLWPNEVHFHSMNPVGVKNMHAEYDFYLRRVVNGGE